MRIENTIIVIGVKEVIDSPELILVGIFMLALMAGIGALFGAAVAPVGAILVYGVYGVLELIFALITHPFTKSRKKIINSAVNSKFDWDNLIKANSANYNWDNLNKAKMLTPTPKSNLPKNYDFDKLLDN